MSTKVSFYLLAVPTTSFLELFLLLGDRIYLLAPPHSSVVDIKYLKRLS